MIDFKNRKANVSITLTNSILMKAYEKCEKEDLKFSHYIDILITADLK